MADDRSAWLFVANPHESPVFSDFEEHGAIERWSLSQHQRAVRKGDHAALWVSGPTAGVYAVGRVKARLTVGPHWNPRRSGETCMYAPLDFQHLPVRLAPTSS